MNTPISSLRDMVHHVGTKEFEQKTHNYTRARLAESLGKITQQKTPAAQGNVFARAQEAVDRLVGLDAALRTLRLPDGQSPLRRARDRLAQQKVGVLGQRLEGAMGSGQTGVARAVLALDAATRAQLQTARDAMAAAERLALDDALLHPVARDLQHRCNPLVRWYLNSPQIWMAAQLVQDHPDTALQSSANTMLERMRQNDEAERTARLRQAIRRGNHTNLREPTSEDDVLLETTAALVNHPLIADSCHGLFERHTPELMQAFTCPDLDDMLESLHVPAEDRMRVIQEAGVKHMNHARLAAMFMRPQPINPSTLRLRAPLPLAQNFEAAVAAHRGQNVGAVAQGLVDSLAEVVGALRELHRESLADDVFWGQVEYLCDHSTHLISLKERGDRLLRDLNAALAKATHAKKTKAAQGTKALTATRKPTVTAPQASTPNANQPAGAVPHRESPGHAAPRPKQATLPTRRAVGGSHGAAAPQATPAVPVITPDASAWGPLPGDNPRPPPTKDRFGLPAPTAGAARPPIGQQAHLPTRLERHAMLQLINATFSPGTFASALASAQYHFKKHAAANPNATIEAYCAEARQARDAWHRRQLVCPRLSNPGQMARLVTDGSLFLLFEDADDGRIISYRNRATMGR